MVYLAWSAAEPIRGLDDGPWAEVFVLASGLRLVDSAETRSRVYHALKAALPTDTALLVAALPDEAKFKGMAPGATAWLRARR